MKRLLRPARTLLPSLGLLLASALAGAQEPAPEPGAPQGDPPPVTLFKLRGGAIQWGTIEEHDADRLAFRRIDTGGLVRMPWSMLDTGQEQALRQRFGYIDVEGQEILIDGHKLILRDGSELVGRILEYGDDVFVLKDRSGARYVKRTLVKQVAEAQVDALEVYTKEELYGRRASELGEERLETDPEANFELAEYCERIFDFRSALTHYQKARQLDAEFRADELPNTIVRVEVKAQQEGQLEMLAALDRLKRKKLYQKALDGLAAFDADYPDSPLKIDRLKLEDRILKARTAEVKELVRRKWYSWTERLIAKAAREQSFEGALAYLEEGLPEEVATLVTEDARKVWPDIEEDQVRQLWIERKPSRWRASSYGLGTWLLGEDDALKGGRDAIPEPEAPASQRDERRADLEEKIQRFLRSQQVARRARRSQEEEDAVENFWQTFPHNSRRNWLSAYFAEHSGLFQLRPTPHLQNCPSCAGKGAIEIVYTGAGRSGTSAGLRLVACETCQGIGVTRRIHYR